MSWTVEFHDDFELEFQQLERNIQDILLAKAKLLQDDGPALSRPLVDTLKASHYPNMKELRFSSEKGVWRVAFIFDPERKAILLVAGNKMGQDQKRFYKRLIQQADQRYQSHLNKLKGRS